MAGELSACPKRIVSAPRRQTDGQPIVSSHGERGGSCCAGVCHRRHQPASRRWRSSRRCRPHDADVFGEPRAQRRPAAGRKPDAIYRPEFAKRAWLTAKRCTPRADAGWMRSGVQPDFFAAARQRLSPLHGLICAVRLVRRAYRQFCAASRRRMSIATRSKISHALRLAGRRRCKQVGFICLEFAAELSIPLMNYRAGSSAFQHGGAHHVSAHAIATSLQHCCNCGA